MAFKKLLNFLFLFVITFSALGQNTWQTKAPFPLGKRYSDVFGIGNYGYLLAGVDSTDGEHNDLWRYDPVTNTWTQLAALSGVARNNGAACVIGDALYYGTGYTGSVFLKDWWKYDVTINTWIQKTDFPGAARYTAMSTTIQGKGYVGLGKGGPSYADWYEYDPGTDTWATKTSYPGPGRNNGVAFSLGNYGYVGLGAYSNTPCSDFYRYDPGTDTWTVRNSYPDAGGIFAVGYFVISNRAFVCGGYDYVNLHTDAFEYNPATDLWTPIASIANVSPGRIFRTGFSVAGKGYLVGGATAIADPNAYRSDLIEYTSNYVGIDDPELNNDISVSYLNDTRQLIITGTYIKSKSSVSVFDAQGKLVDQLSVESIGEKKFPLEVLSGVYFYHVKNENQLIARGKFLVVK